MQSSIIRYYSLLVLAHTMTNYACTPKWLLCLLFTVQSMFDAVHQAVRAVGVLSWRWFWVCGQPRSCIPTPRQHVPDLCI